MREDMVIHGGKLMPEAQAWTEMMQEFPPHGYSMEAIRRILDRAVAATQNLLACIAKLPERERAVQLEWALRADAQAAERWRSQWSGYKPQVSEETHAEKLARYQRDMALQGFPQYQESEQERVRRVEQIKRYHERRALEEKALEEKEAQARAKAYTEDYRKAQAVHGRKARRKRPPKGFRYFYEWYEPPLVRGGTRDGMLALLDDHHYIDLMFECHTRGWMAPL
jgi:hypothetical protein